MDWVLRSPQVHSAFSNLGFMHADGYHVNESCNEALESVLHNILSEDRYLRPYRRTINFGQHVQKDLIPLLINAKEYETIELIVIILMNLTTPIECLLSVEYISQSDFGRHTLYELNNLLASTKKAFTDDRTTKVIMDFFKKSSDFEQNPKITLGQCTNISNCLLLFRNILYIPEEANSPSAGNTGSSHAVQNQILWNIFSQSFDKVLIKLMTVPEASVYGVSLVQLIALLYKNQHSFALHKLLNVWIETKTLSDSSEDNESNTTPLNRGSEDSSPMLTSDPTSDSSDTGANGKKTEEPNSKNNGWGSSENNTSENDSPPCQQPSPVENDGDITMRDRSENETSNSDENSKSDKEEKLMSASAQSETSNSQRQPPNTEKQTFKSENSDCGYGTQIENQESVSTSSNDDATVSKKPVHQKPHNPKVVKNNKVPTAITIHDRKRKKLVKRAKANIINVQGLTHKSPSDDEIANVLKEFTVDFLLKGYNIFVRTLHSEILTNLKFEIDTSHFFWLITYFLKLATQIGLEMEQISSVLSFEMVSYLTSEGVNLCEQFELALKVDGNELAPSIRRLHLIITAIREFVQAINDYNKFPHLNAKDQERINTLRTKMCELDELRSLMVLLLRTYNPKYHSKAYLQDLIVTNHLLLLFLDNGLRSPDGDRTLMVEHIQQFASPEIMYQYGLLLEDYMKNGEFVNDCIFTMMHHVGGELDRLICLFQPKILKVFTCIWESEFELCDDWADLVEYVINTFIKKPRSLHIPQNIKMETEDFEAEMAVNKPTTLTASAAPAKEENQTQKKADHSSTSNGSIKKWTEDELSSLSWHYMQCNTRKDVVGEIIKCLKEDGSTKSRKSVIKALFKENIISKEEFEKYSKNENDKHSKMKKINKEIRDVEIGKLCEQLRQDGKSKCFDWVQKVLLKTCHAKLYFEKKSVKCAEENVSNAKSSDKSDILQFKFFNQEIHEMPVLSPVTYHSLLLDQSVPLVPWNCEQAFMCKDLKFLQLLHKLGFQMPVDTGKVFIRIPHIWPSEILYELAGRVGDIDTTKLKFSMDDLTDVTAYPVQPCTPVLPVENYYQIHKQRHLTTMVTFIPMPGSSFGSESVRKADLKAHCWLEVVQQSHEIKLSCSFGSAPVEPMVVTEEGIADKAVAKAVPPVGVSDLLPPKVDNTFDADLLDSDDDDSIYAASVDSDLTRMYVSDEDEKSQLPPRPRGKMHSPSKDSFPEIPMT